MHGRAGAEAVVPLLEHPSAEVQRRAAIALDQFEQLKPDHLPALIASYRRGLDVADAIARTGSEEALRFIEAAWSVADEGRNARSALSLFGRRAEPFLMGQLERCRRDCAGSEVDTILYGLDRIGPLPERAREMIRNIAAAGTAPPDLRRAMEEQLIDRSDPAALPIIVRRLGALRADPYEDAAAFRLLERLRYHGEAAREAGGPAILSYLGRPELRRARREAVVASWVVGYRPAVPALRAMLAEAENDWLLAYNALFALAQLGGSEARPEIARLAREHWHLPVRNNARRALNMLDGGTFALPELGDEMRGPYVGELRFAADVHGVRDCRFDLAGETLRFGRGTPVPARSRRTSAVRIALDEPAREAIPGGVPGIPSGSRIALHWQRAGDRVIGVDGQRLEGGLFMVDGRSGAHRILADSVLAAFDAGSSLLVVTGDSTHFSDEADLWRLAPESLAVIEGPLRLPATPRGFALASDRTLLIRTERGDLAVSAEGRLMPPRPCDAAAPAQ
ncbi:MAG: hypothetical protein QOC65_168 [Sphingomonadales bacterium]|nr:hypothetical protein [Sphingomonadales bacterium]